jgi:hypothetical protein
MTIDDVLPTWHWRSAHATRVAAPPERAAAAARAVNGRDLPLTGALMRARMLGRHRVDGRPLLQSMRAIGLVILADDPATVDAVARRRFGRYWRVIGPFSGITRREMLAAIKRRAET